MAISLLSVIVVNSITGNIAVISQCPEKCTYFPLRTIGDYELLKERLPDYFYIYGIYPATGFNSEGEYIACACIKK